MMNTVPGVTSPNNNNPLNMLSKKNNFFDLINNLKHLQQNTKINLDILKTTFLMFFLS